MSDGGIDAIVAHYLELRRQKESIAAAAAMQAAPLTASMKRIEESLLAYLSKQNATSIKTNHGTPYIHTTLSATIADPSAFTVWLLENIGARIGFLERRISKDTLKSHLEDGHAMPPGVNTATINVLRIREANEK